MSKEEILELLALRGWDRTKLGAQLNLSANTVQTWLSGTRNPSGPASILMRQWLEEARAAEKLATAS